MLAIAGAVTWFGYALFVYGLSQVADQNYGFKDITWPGRFTLGNPAPDPPGPGTITGGGVTLPKASKGSGVHGSTGISASGGVGAKCNKGYNLLQVNTMKNGKCPAGTTDIGTPGNHLCVKCVKAS
jgi:hypothetical protein